MGWKFQWPRTFSATAALFILLLKTSNMLQLSVFSIYDQVQLWKMGFVRLPRTMMLGNCSALLLKVSSSCLWRQLR
ncbi:hypothetical protein LINPERPRIM_LOCUS21071 [Linum perenne]